jgi:hypothetical protein
MTNYAELLAQIATDITIIRTRFSLSSVGKAFMFWYATVELDLGEEEAEEAVSYDGGNDKAIDFFYVDEEHSRVIVAQGKFDGKGDHKADEGEFLKLVHTTDWLSNPETFRSSGRPDLGDAADDYLAALARGYSTEFHYVYMGPLHRDVTDAAHAFNAANGAEIPSRSARVVSLPVLQQIYDEYAKAPTRIRAETLTIEPGKGFEEIGAFGRAFVASLPGAELQRLYDVHGDALFDRNVRLFLGSRKGGVNAGINETLQTPTERPNFWAYNNGITVVCDGYDHDPASQQLTIRSFSIVNGCQTTVSVANGPRPVPPEVAVLARFIDAPREQVVDAIIRYNNSQTPIRPWDISTQDKIQKRLRAELTKGSTPYFYELRRGETRRMSAEDKRPFIRDGKFQTIRFDALAQYLAAFRGLPIAAYKDKNTLFDQHRHAVFPTDLTAEECVLVWQASEAAIEAVRSAKERAGQREQEGHLRILKRGAPIFVAAVMAIILRERNGPNYLRRVTREKAGSHATRRRLDQYAQVAVAWYLDAVGDVVAQGMELTTLLRSQDLFKRVEEKILSKWEVQRVSQAWVDDALPKF